MKKYILGMVTAICMIPIYGVIHRTYSNVTGSSKGNVK